jgi:formate-dependent nitrite reductase cytochrome c552 subunit
MRRQCTVLCMVATAALLWWPAAWAQAPRVLKPALAAAPAAKDADCFACHVEIESLKTAGKHAGVGCPNCHAGLDAHMKDPASRPGTRLDHEACAACHKDQYDSFLTFDAKRLARVEKSLPTERAPNPLWDKLMMGHGFTKEHTAPRGHPFMLVDHLVVDRTYGGRFQPKSGWQYVTAKGNLKAWDVLRDTHPETREHKAFLPESAAAANPTCLSCKTADNILRVKHLGDKDPQARWDRTSNPVDVATASQHALNCVFCHDPHAARPRVIRDALVQALTRPEADTLWHRDPKRTAFEVRDFRDGFRKIALLPKYDTKLQCAQCHVEYNCNAGINPTDGSRIGYGSALTNHFPLKDVFAIYDHYNALNFRDFRHQLTGGLLWKAQHPESETYWNSAHDKAGVSCNDCHMPKVRNRAGRVYTSHWQVSPRNYLGATCLRCHKGMTEQDAVYQIDSIKSFTRGKMRKAEFWIAALIDKVVEGRKSALDQTVIQQAQEQHARAHALWEWWTAENSDGFHNPAAARESLTRSVEEAKKGIKIIDDATADKARQPERTAAGK